MKLPIVSILFVVLAISWRSTKCLSVDFFMDWIQELNAQLSIVYQRAAYYAWNLSVNPNDELAGEAQEFNANKSEWGNSKCAEIQKYFASQRRHMSSATNLTILNAAARLLCTGPKFSDAEAESLTTLLQEMQTIFTATEICLPQRFDVCLNWDRIWDFTYISHEDHFERLNLDAVKPKQKNVAKLHLFDSNIPKNYYLNGAQSISNERKVDAALRSSDMVCLGGEEELDRIMAGDFSAFNRSDCALQFNKVLRWTWESWRAAVGNRIGAIYSKAIHLMNIGAKSNGYSDIGDVWRQELELPHLRAVMDLLLEGIRPFYRLLHGVLRNVLWSRINKFEPFNSKSTIPAHMLGSMWSQNWQAHQNLILPFREFNLEQKMKELNWTSIDMVKKADDFYRSLSLPAMTSKFWQNSIFERSDRFRNCHGTAANMFDSDDYRMIVCSEASLRDFGVIVHEMGHLQYFMAYKNQPTIFQDGNAAIQESIGDAIFLGIMTPHHLNRLNLISDKFLVSKQPTIFSESVLRVVHSRYQFPRAASAMNMQGDHLTVGGMAYPNISQLNQDATVMNESESRDTSDFDLALLLNMALAKIPAIPFQYLMDVFRWGLFNKTVPMHDANAFYWNLAMAEQGIHPPNFEDRRDYFDLGAKFHIADNTPFARYFLASFIQAQIFEGLCKVTIYDTVRTNEPLPMPLHRCDIYGSKRAGKLLKKALQLGTTRHWTDVLYILTGSREIKTDALLLYYKPLISWLNKLTEKFKIPVGW